jgi:truncated hemoglobin YjbI
MQSAQKPSLYDRLGGVYSIATVVDDFIDRVMADPRLNANPLVEEAHHRLPPAGFKYLVPEMVCWATGGPQKYTETQAFTRHVFDRAGEVKREKPLHFLAVIAGFALVAGIATRVWRGRADA